MTLNIGFTQINIRGLSGKEKILGDHLRAFKTDIVLVTELQPKGFRTSTQKFKVPGWETFMESPRCAVLVKDSHQYEIKHVRLGIDEVALPKADYERHPYGTSIRLYDPESKKSTACCMYLPLT